VLHWFWAWKTNMYMINSIHNKHLSETWTYEKRLRLWFISQCNLLVTLFYD
jgi:hypothetical protein